MNAKVSIVTRTKNRPVLLERAIKSVLGQTMRDFALVIVNDSPDRAPVEALIKKYEAEAAGRIIFVQNEASSGRWGALNAGIDAAVAEYFILHDDDDAWHPDFLLKTTEYLDAHPEEGGVGTRTELVYEEIKNNTVIELRREPYATHYHEMSFVETLRMNYVPPIALLLRRSTFDVIGRFSTELPVLGDWEFNLRLLSKYTVGFLDNDTLAYWHHRENSTGDEGNSVIAELHRHQQINLAIRDNFIRKGIEAGDQLGPMLLTAEFVRQLDVKADASRREQIAYEREQHTAHMEHLNIVHRELFGMTNELKGAIESLTAEVASLQAQVTTLSDTPSIGQDLSKAARGIVGRIRRIGKSN